MWETRFNSSTTASSKNPFPLISNLAKNAILKSIKSSPEKLLAPVIKSTLLALIKPQPSHASPLGFAIITAASVPNTSAFPSKELILLPVA